MPPALLAAALAATPSAAQGNDDFDAIRAVTDSFHSVEQATRAGYLDNPLPCFDDPAGGMGEHLIDESRIDNVLDPLRPEALVYEVSPHGQPKLVAVEYLAPRTDDNAPTLLGRSMQPTTVGGTDLWELHAWVWRDNPLGAFEDWNPTVAPCP